MNPKLLGILFCVMGATFEACGQIAFKFAADRSPQTGGLMARLVGAVRNGRLILLGVVGFALQAVVWTLALQRLDVSLAYPLASVDVVVITLLSRAIVGERITLRRWGGIGLVLAGAALVSAS